MSEDIEKIKQRRKEWEDKVLKPALDRFWLKESHEFIIALKS